MTERSEATGANGAPVMSPSMKPPHGAGAHGPFPHEAGAHGPFPDHRHRGLRRVGLRRVAPPSALRVPDGTVVPR